MSREQRRGFHSAFECSDALDLGVDTTEASDKVDVGVPDARTGSRVGSTARPRKLSNQAQAFLRKTSVMLADPESVNTMLSKAEVKRLRAFESKYLARPVPRVSAGPISVRSTPQEQASDRSIKCSQLNSQQHPVPQWWLDTRERLRHMTKHAAFRTTLMCVILADMATLASDNKTLGAHVKVADIVLTLLIGLEIVIKMVAFGLWSDRNSYLRKSKFRILNIVCVVASLLSHLGGDNYKFLRAIKLFRCLTMSAGLRRILTSLIRAVPFLANVGTLTLFFLLAFSIFGLEAFHDAFSRQCAVDYENLPALPRVYCSDNSSCGLQDQLCMAFGPPSKYVNFDSGISSIFLVFLVVAQDGWVSDIMEPVVEYSSPWSVLFFVLIVASMVFLVVNLFVAVITTSFMGFSGEIETNHQAMYMGKMSPAVEEARVSLIMGATLAIEQSLQDNDADDVDDTKSTTTTSMTANGNRLLSNQSFASRNSTGFVRQDFVDMLAKTHQWRSLRNLTVETAMEMLQGDAEVAGDFMLPLPLYEGMAARGSSSAPSVAGTGRVGKTARYSERTSIDAPNAVSSMSVQQLLTISETSGESVSRFVVGLQRIVFSRRFDDFITSCIIANTGFLLIEYPGMGPKLTQVLSVTEYLFGIIFFLEMVLRIIAMRGVRPYLRSTERFFDMIVVLCTSINMVLNQLETTYSGLNSVSSVRTLRVGRLMMKWEGTRKLVQSVMKSSRAVMNVVAFMLLFHVVNSITAMELFGANRLSSEGQQPRWNFDSFGRAFLTLLQVITGDQWSSITYDAVDADNPHWFMVPFLIINFIIGQYVVLNLFIAVILENFAISDEEAYQLQLEQIIAIPKELDIYEKIEEVGVRAFGEMDQLDHVSNVKLRMFLGLDDENDTAGRSHEQASSNRERMGASGSQRWKQQRGGPNSPWHERAWIAWNNVCRRIVASVWFSRAIQFVIGVSCVCLIIESPHPNVSPTPPSPDMVLTLNVVNKLVLTVLLLEFFIKVSANGFGWSYVRLMLFHHEDRLGYVRKQAYIEDGWNQLDLVLLLFALLDESLSAAAPNLSVARVFRSARVLRPLRVLNQNREMKLVLNAVAQSLPHVGNVFALCSLVYIIFGVVGRSFFAGKLYSCNDSSVLTRDECVGFYLVAPDGTLALQEATARGVQGSSILMPRVWSNARFSFDHIGAAFLSLLEMTTLKWIDKTFVAMDIMGTNMQPQTDVSPQYALFFVLYVYIGALFVVRLFVGVLVEQFQRNNGTQILTESQKCWVDLEKFVLLLKPLKRIPRPTTRLQSKLFDMCQHQHFATAVSVAIVLNVVLLLVNPGTRSITDTSFLVIEAVFLAVFSVEAISKSLAFRHFYVFSWHGAFEILILIGSIVAFCLQSGYHSLLQAGRIFRIMRVLRFVKLNRGVHTIFQTFRGSLHSIANIFFLLFLIIFIFAVIGRQLFGGIRLGSSLNHFSNFRSFGSSVRLLFQILSGDDWHLTMTDCMVTTPSCVEGYNENDEWVSDCGTAWAAVPFFVTYILFVVFVFLNLFIAVILENFRSCYLKNDICAISLGDFETYREVFVRYDVDNSGTIPLWQLARLLSELPPSLRIDRNQQRTAFLHIRTQAQALLDLPKASQKRPFFNELLRILCIHQMGIRSLPYEQQRDRVKQIFIYRTKVASMIVESLVKGYLQRRKIRLAKHKTEAPSAPSDAATDLEPTKPQSEQQQQQDHREPGDGGGEEVVEKRKEAALVDETAEKQEEQKPIAPVEASPSTTEPPGPSESQQSEENSDLAPSDTHDEDATDEDGVDGGEHHSHHRHHHRKHHKHHKHHHHHHHHRRGDSHKHKVHIDENEDESQEREIDQQVATSPRSHGTALRHENEQIAANSAPTTTGADADEPSSALPELTKKQHDSTRRPRHHASSKVVPT